MLIEKKIDDGNYWFTKFFGGIKRGACIQLTFPFHKNYIVFTKNELKQFIEDAKIVLDKLN
jgi:hypothetical protein